MAKRPTNTVKKSSDKNKRADFKTIVIVLTVFLIFVIYLQNIRYGLYGAETDVDILTQINAILDAFLDKPIQFNHAPAKYLFSVVPVYIYGSVMIVAYMYIKEPRKTREGIEQGSAAWNEDIGGFNRLYNEPFNEPKVDKEPENIKQKKYEGKEVKTEKKKIKGTFQSFIDDPSKNSNAILSDEVYLSLAGKSTNRNNNTLVLGGSGTGKSRFYVKPNVLQMNSSYVVTDPSGELLEDLGTAMSKNGYKLKVLNIVDMEESLRYNPFKYVKTPEDVAKMVDIFIENTTKDGAKGGDPFWENTEKTLILALSNYLFELGREEDMTFTNVKRLIDLIEVDEDDPDKETVTDILLREHGEKHPESIAVRYYGDFKIGAGKTLKSILISVKTRMQPFNMPQVQRLTSKDELELDKIGEEKTILYCIMPNAEKTFNFIIAMMYSQLFNTLYRCAEGKPGKSLPIPVRCLLDEFANIGKIPNFPELLATMRKYNISCSVILQDISQLKTMYKDDWEGVTGNCDTMLFLGGQGSATCEFVSKKLGNETISNRNTSESLGRQKSTSRSYNILKRELMTPDELARMDNSDCVITIRGELPFLSKKYRYERHPNYKLTTDNDKGNFFKLSEHPDLFNKGEVVDDTDKRDYSESIISEEELNFVRRDFDEINKLAVMAFDDNNIKKIGFDTVEDFVKEAVIPDPVKISSYIETLPEGSKSKLDTGDSLLSSFNEIKNDNKKENDDNEMVYEFVKEEYFVNVN